MRADRLVSLVLLLRQRGQMSAQTLASELEVSTRTVLRDIESLSAAGVPVYAERGRHGGFALLPGFRAELMGLSQDESLALLTAGSGRGGQVFGLSAALTSAMRKLLDALPETHKLVASDAAQRFLVEPETDLLSRRQDRDETPESVMAEVRRAVLVGHKLHIQYASPGREPTPRIVDPLGLVTVREKGYLLGLVKGRDRTYRLSRIQEAKKLADPAERPENIDLGHLWQEHSDRFRAGGDSVVVRLRMEPARREEIVGTALAVLTEEVAADGWLLIEATFQDLRHAVWALWQLDDDAEALEPASLRDALHERAAVVAARYERRG